MKNIEINTKAIKKIFAAGLLSLTMAGCSGNNEPTKQETPKENKTEDVIKKDDKTGFEYIQMSDEETKKLKSGDFIESEDGKTIKVPDRAILESLGYDFEYEIDCLSRIKAGEFVLYSSYVVYGDHLENFISWEYAKGDQQNESKYNIKGIRIIEIMKVYEDNGKIMKDIESTGGYNLSVELSNPDNYDKLQELGLGSISYVYTKQR